MGTKRNDLTGLKFGKLKVLKYVGNNSGHALWLCECECGNKKEIENRALKGTVVSCGCSNHKMSKTRFYRVWRKMHERCYKTYATNYKWYGGKGVKISIEWNDFLTFKKDMYESYLKHIENHGENDTTLDRIDPTKDYSLSNCRWATWEIQANNKRKEG